MTITSFPKPQRKCLSCGIVLSKPKKYSLTQWSQTKFCSRQCSAKVKRINDGLTRDQRRTKKMGGLKRGSPEWIERIRSTTKDAMKKPDVKLKLSQPRSPMSLEARIRHSNLLAGKMPKNIMFGGSGNYPNIQRGDYECSKGSVYFRSKWEANYALYLDFLVERGEIASWEYEVDVFMFEEIKLGTRSYRPDFKIFNIDDTFEYHEVKGYMDSKSKTKLRRMAKYYPEVKLVLIDRPVYMDICKKLGKMLSFY